MILKYSKTNTPYIELDKGAKLIFSSSTESPKGFKYLVFSNRITKTLCISGAKAKKARYAKIWEDCNFTTTMDFDKIPRKAKEFGLSNITRKILKKLIFGMTDGEGHFHRNNLKTLELKLNEINGLDSDNCDDDLTATESYDD